MFVGRNNGTVGLVRLLNKKNDSDTKSGLNNDVIIWRRFACNESPLYLLAKLIHVKILGLFTRHEQT